MQRSVGKSGESTMTLLCRSLTRDAQFHSAQEVANLQMECARTPAELVDYFCDPLGQSRLQPSVVYPSTPA